ncbi:hypothetical protein [Hymenobacter cellulosivorans]|uniref:Translation initiation factor IF-2 n=1 Tax=Hymenobacter cellulosivorans TaxID=2932249 RepID=A0ABY4FHW9_9BACT|nr:hypothetical protein [Hymenobacter cellulosivorans]UOQ55602.1 hypothetical protein MUN80_12775 [Hymenobacter cellulosivorans]
MTILIRLLCMLVLLTAALPGQAHHPGAVDEQGDKPRRDGAAPPVKVVPQSKPQSKPQRVEGGGLFGRSTDHSARGDRPERSARSARSSSSRSAEGGRSARSSSSNGGSRGGGAGRGHGRGH